MDGRRFGYCALAWFLFCVIVSLAFTFAALVGCASGSTSWQYMLSISPPLLVTDLITAAYGRSDAYLPSNITKLTQDAFVRPLPTFYYIGVSGTCRWNETANLQICGYNFPQRADFLRLVSQDIGSTNSSQYNTWATLLNVGWSMEKNRQMWTSLAAAAAALLILSIILSFSIIFFTCYNLRGESRDWLLRGGLRISIGLSLVDALLVLVAASLWTHMRLSVIDGRDENSISSGPGLWLLWFSFLLKLFCTAEFVKFFCIRPLTWCFGLIKRDHN
jgi:hypothetical protein